MNGNVPFKNIYSNDTTHLENCTSPYRAKGADFSPEQLRQSVKELQGLADAHFIQLAHGQVPWYQSKLYPMKEHLDWWSEYFEVPREQLERLRGFTGYVRDGGDILQDFIDACREFGQAAFVSLRMNDEHHIENCDKKGHTRGIHSISRFAMEHRQFMFGEDLTVWSNRAQNWINPEVRDFMFSIISEQCENYDIDGFELDFMRYPDLFDLERTSLDERRAIMSEFITRVRRELDRTERGGKHRYLCIRVPSSIPMLDNIGVELESLYALGVEMLNVSSSYFTEQYIDFEGFCKGARDVAVYFEICHCTTIGTALNANGYDNFRYRRTTPNEIYTTAHMAYSHGAQGMSYFNFVYYREHGSEGRGPFNEPPFEVIGKAKDKDFVASAPKHFFLAKGWHSSSHVSQLGPMLPCNTDVELQMYVKESEDAWQGDFRARIMTRTPIGDRRVSLTFGGYAAVPDGDISEPYVEDNAYVPMHGDSENSLAWRVPREAVRDGINKFVLRFESDAQNDEIRVDYIDLFPYVTDKKGSEK